MIIRILEHTVFKIRLNNVGTKIKSRGGKMKNKMIRNIILTMAISSVIAVPTYAKNINAPNIVKDIKIIPISHILNHWITSMINFTLGDQELTDEGIIKTGVAKEIIEKTAEDLMNAIKNKDAESIADYVHPDKGVRFTPYTTVSTENDVVMNQENIKKFFEDEKSYTWGYYDGRGDEIKLTPSDYYEKFIYTEDFMNTAEIGYNEVLSSGNMIENQFDVYENAIVVEYYIPGVNPEYGGIDWQSLRLVFEEYEGNWKLVGIIHNQWTI